MKLRYLVLSLAILYITPIFAQNQLVVLGYDYDSPRSGVILNQIKSHIENITNTYTKLDYVQENDFKNILVKKNIINKNEIIKTAGQLDIPVIVFISLSDSVNKITISFSAYGTAYPYNGRIISSFKKSIDVQKNIPTSTYNLISEDISLQFIIEFLKKYDFPDFSKPAPAKQLYTFKDIEGYNIPVKASPNADPKKTFFINNYLNTAEKLEKLYLEKKKTMAINKITVEKGLALALMTPVLSTLSPVITPFNYYQQREYKPLAYWFINSLPYYSIATYGITNRPQVHEENNQNISKFQKSSYYFAWYQFLAGGMPFFIDSSIQPQIYNSSNYIKKESYVDNDGYAVFLSLISNGGGHFYKGHRKWGYVYYNVDNLLLFSTIYFFSTKSTYSETNNKYSESGRDKRLGTICGSLFAIVKAVEIYHVMQLKTNLKTGSPVEDLYSFDMHISENESLIFTMSRKF